MDLAEFVMLVIIFGAPILIGIAAYMILRGADRRIK